MKQCYSCGGWCGGGHDGKPCRYENVATKGTMHEQLLNAIERGIAAQCNPDGSWITGQSTAAMAALLNVEELLRTREAAFHRDIKNHLTPRQQGYTMGAFRAALGLVDKERSR